MILQVMELCRGHQARARQRVAWKQGAPMGGQSRTERNAVGWGRRWGGPNPGNSGEAAGRLLGQSRSRSGRTPGLGSGACGWFPSAAGWIPAGPSPWGPASTCPNLRFSLGKRLCRHALLSMAKTLFAPAVSQLIKPFHSRELPTVLSRDILVKK